MTFDFLKVKSNNTDALQIEVGLCCVPCEEVQPTLKNVSLSKVWELITKHFLDSLPTFTTHQIRLDTSSLKKEKSSCGSDNVHVFVSGFAVKKTLLLVLSGLVAKPPTRYHSVKRFGQIPVTGAHYLGKSIWRTASEEILFHKALLISSRCWHLWQEVDLTTLSWSIGSCGCLFLYPKAGPPRPLGLVPCFFNMSRKGN